MASIVSLILVLVIKSYTNEKKPVEPVPEYKFNNYVDAFNLTLTSYGFFNKLFPVICEMESRTYRDRMIAIGCTLLCVFSFYSSFAYLAINEYGSSMQINILNNFG